MTQKPPFHPGASTRPTGPLEKHIGVSTGTGSKSPPTSRDWHCHLPRGCPWWKSLYLGGPRSGKFRPCFLKVAERGERVFFTRFRDLEIATSEGWEMGFIYKHPLESKMTIQHLKIGCTRKGNVIFQVLIFLGGWEFLGLGPGRVLRKPSKEFNWAMKD